MSKYSTLRVGIAGFGGAGMAHHQYFQRILDCNVVSVFDPLDAGLQRARALSDTLNVTSDFEQFLNSGIDVVSICSPDCTHSDYMVRSLAAGKHTICEKPLCDSLEGCRKILLAERNAPDCVAAVQHQMRFLPIHLKMKDVVNSGELGEISYIEGYYVHNLTERASRYHPWRFDDNATPLVYSGCHFIDLLRWILGEEVDCVMGMANNIAFPEYPESDLNVILLRFKSGVIGKVVTAFGAGRPQDHSVRIYGSQNSIENNLLFSKDGTFKVFARPSITNNCSPLGGRRHRLRQIRRNFAPWLTGRLFELLVRGQKGGGEYGISSYPLRLYEHSDACVASISNFVEAIRNNWRPQCNVLDSARTVATSLAGVEAYKSGRTVDVARYLEELEQGVTTIRAVS